ncbi:MAG: cell division protein FtsZ [Thermodesulfobacteriota bacterium]|nr:cell division protein FtsZ [Thermodesulfobacteriota bacterium]
MMFSFVESEKSAKIKVIGVGGAGGNAVNNMIESKLQGVKFISANTDIQSLEVSKAPVKIQMGEKLTEGLGAGANPDVGRQAASESEEAIRSVVEGSHMIFITAGLGGGTGTGASPVIAEISKESGALTVAVVTKPFGFEGKKRMKQAEEGLKALKDVVDTVITIPNDRLRGLASRNDTMLNMFRKADEVLLHSVKGITDLIMMPGLVNLDFADVRTTMCKAGMALMGTGIASGENRALEAAERAISHPLLEDISVAGARGVLMNLTSGTDLTMAEMTEASDLIHNEAGDSAEIIWGAVLDDSVGDELRVTVIATGIEPEGEWKKTPFSGKLYDITEADLRKHEDLDTPTFLREEKLIGEASRTPHIGYGGMVLDHHDLEVPTFMRRKAD